MDTVSAENSQELTDSLAKIDITVPPRTAGRTTEHCERWSICRWLSTQNSQSSIDFPMTLIDRESPDFRLDTPNGTTGIEVTEAVPVDFAKATALAEKEGGEFLDFPEFSGETRRRRRNSGI